MHFPFRLFRFLLPWTVLAAIAVIVAIAALTLRVWDAFPGDAIFPVECGLVFGAAVHSGDDPGPGIMRRTATAARLMREGKVQRLIFSGGRGEESSQSEAAVMRRVAMRAGVDPDLILLEEESTSTWENLVYARPLVEDCGSIVGISDRYHLARIQYFAKIQGWGNLPAYPADNPPNDAFIIRSVIREILAMFYYMLVPPQAQVGS
jgi:uncharacterized SAM-binding protein YcdF (DUF218 family)